MAIIYARRIPHGLEGAESCGTNQKWDPNYVYNGIKGQCVPASQPLVQMASSSPSFLTSLMSAFSTPKYTTPSPAVAPIAPASGVSPTVMIAVGVGLLAVVLIASRR